MFSWQLLYVFEQGMQNFSLLVINSSPHPCLLPNTPPQKKKLKKIKSTLAHLGRHFSETIKKTVESEWIPWNYSATTFYMAPIHEGDCIQLDSTNPNPNPNPHYCLQKSIPRPQDAVRPAPPSTQNTRCV